MLFFNSGLLKSKGEARRMIKQGAVRLDDVRISDLNSIVSPKGTQVLKVGKRRFLRVVP